VFISCWVGLQEGAKPEAWGVRLVGRVPFFFLWVVCTPPRGGILFLGCALEVPGFVTIPPV